jgi:hypothetical protein
MTHHIDRWTTSALARALPVVLCTTLAGCSLTARRHTEAPSLVPQRDSLAVQMQGLPMGTEVSSLERTPTGWRYTTMTSVADVKQISEVQARPDGAVERMHQRVERGDVVAVSDLSYTGGRIRGTVQLPSRTSKGVETITIDTVAVAGVIDDNFIAAVQPSLAWAPGATITVPVFVGGLNETQMWTFRVVGTEKVTVPAGTFPAYRVELQVGAHTLLSWVEVAAPHRVLKRVPVGSPIEIVRLQ